MGRNRGVNFTKTEIENLTKLVSKFPTIECKLHNKKNEVLRKNAWDMVLVEFNSNEENSNRTVDQLRNAWKRIKKDRKAQLAFERRSKVKTGGGPPDNFTEDGDIDQLVDSLLSDQVPLYGIPDDDSDLDSLSNNADDKSEADHENMATVSTITAPAEHFDMPQAEEIPPPPSTNKGKTPNRVRNFSKIFHDEKMKCLREEQNMKRKILEEELLYWRERREQQKILFEKQFSQWESNHHDPAQFLVVTSENSN